MLLKEREVPRNQDKVSNHCYLDEAVAAWYAKWGGSEIPGCYVKCQPLRLFTDGRRGKLSAVGLLGASPHHQFMG